MILFMDFYLKTKDNNIYKPTFIDWSNHSALRKTVHLMEWFFNLCFKAKLNNKRKDVLC